MILIWWQKVKSYEEKLLMKKLAWKSTLKKLTLSQVVPSLHGKYKGKVESVTDFIFLGLKITVNGDCSQAIEDTPWKESYAKPR